MDQRNPFIAGRWVTSPHFYGRVALIDDLIESHETCHWVIGKRRVGKTSLLRQLEQQVQAKGSSFALFWDVQGSYDTHGLADSFFDAIEDSRDMFPLQWNTIDLQLNAQMACHQALKQLARIITRKYDNLILLIDEAEEFINIGRQDADYLSKMRKIMQHTNGLRTILCSTTRLEQLHQVASLDTSPFLHGFESRFIGNLEHRETLDLLSSGLELHSVAEEIFTLTEGNPFETQLVAKHVFENPDIEMVCQEMETNPSLVQVIEVNFDLLNDIEKNIMKDVFCGKSSLEHFQTAQERNYISRLLKLGYLTTLAESSLAVTSHFVRKWLAARFESSPAFHAQHHSDASLSQNDSISILRQLPGLYKYYLETAGRQQRISNPEFCFRISNYDGTIYPDRLAIKHEDYTASEPAWFVAIRELLILVETFLKRDSSWTLYRLFQMAETGDQYAETDYLDIMLLISDEAELS